MIMAFSFNGGKKNDNKTFDPTQGFEMMDTTQDSHSGGGFGGFTLGDLGNIGTGSSDLIESCGDGSYEGTTYGGKGRKHGGIKIDPAFLRVLIIALLLLAAVILVIVFWDRILQLLYSLGAILVILIIVLIIFRMLFPRRRR